MPIVSGGGGGTTAAQVATSGKVIPVADSASATVDTTTYDNNVTGSGKLTTLVLPQDTGVFAVAVSGDTWPRWILCADGDDGLYFGDGSINPLGSGRIKSVVSGGVVSVRIKGSSSKRFDVGVFDPNILSYADFNMPITLEGNLTLRAGSGAPAVGGYTGDLYVRSDPGGVLQTLYRCTADGIAGVATWVGIL